MNVFNKYAKYYDLLYNEKDYETEIFFLEKIFSAYAKRPVRDILDLGCGTGGHSILLAQRGYQVVGIDQSEEMLSEAEIKTKGLTSPLIAPKFQKGDIRNFRTDQKFDAVISMFAVMSYMISNNDLLDAVKTAKNHLKPGGLFYFDAWFGPAVLTEKPSDRYKIIKSDNEQIIRFAQPNTSIENQTVDVKYKILQISNNIVLNEIDEIHTMRYFFPQEIIFYLKSVGFDTVSVFPFLNIDQPLSEKDWNIAVVALNANN
jgi:SAM-dependent methyltransferase